MSMMKISTCCNAGVIVARRKGQLVNVCLDCKQECQAVTQPTTKNGTGT